MHHFQLHIGVIVALAVCAVGFPGEDSPARVEERLVCSNRLKDEFRKLGPEVTAKAILLRMNPGLAGDLFGNRIDGLLYTFALRLQRTRPTASRREIVELVQQIYHRYAMACAGIEGTDMKQLGDQERLNVYVEFGSATVDLESLIKYHDEPWFEDGELFKQTEFNSREIFPSDEDKLEQWMRLAERWYLSHN